MQSHSRILVNLPVKLSRTLVNLVVNKVKLTRMNPNGGHGGGSPLPVPGYRTLVVLGSGLGPTPQRWATGLGHCACRDYELDYELDYW